MVQKCLCGAVLETVKKGMVFRCPVEGIVYTYAPSEMERTLQKNGSLHPGRENKPFLEVQEELQTGDVV